MKHPLAKFHVLVGCAVLLAGCVGLPSGWSPFKTPVEKFDKKAAQQAEAQVSALQQARAAVHQAWMALQTGTSERAREVADNFLRDGKALMDQVLGAPTLAQETAWRDLVVRLMSENAAIRAKAENERRADAARAAEAADKLAALTAEKERASAKVREYALENERLADMVRKVVWVGGGLAGLWILGQVLALVARFNPALGGISAAVNAVAAPAVQYAYNRAQTGLQKVGEGMAAVRTQLPEVAEKIRGLMNQATDSDHQQVIGGAADSILEAKK